MLTPAYIYRWDISSSKRIYDLPVRIYTTMNIHGNGFVHQACAIYWVLTKLSLRVYACEYRTIRRAAQTPKKKNKRKMSLARTKFWHKF